MKEIITQEVFVGRRPFHSYVGHVSRMLRSYGSVRLYARGDSIPKAIDVAMITSRRRSVGCSIKEARVGTDRLDDRSGRDGRRDVSTIAIDMCLNGPTVDLLGRTPVAPGRQSGKKDSGRQRREGRERMMMMGLHGK